MLDLIPRPLIEDLQHPENAYSMFLARKDAVPLELRQASIYEFHNIFAQAMAYLLFEMGESSGFANLTIFARPKPSNQTLQIRWESGISEQMYLDKACVQEMKKFIQAHYQHQIELYRQTSKI